MPKVTVFHRDYGCESGCCGHVVSIDGLKEKFKFEHPYGATETPERLKEWIKDIVTRTVGEEHVADIDWDNCVISES